MSRSRGCIFVIPSTRPCGSSPTSIPKGMFNSLSSNISIHFGMTGTNLVIAAACASSASAIGLASLLIRHGYADVALAGGADSPLTPAMFTCWTRLRVLAQNSNPQRASRPFDRQRNGMVLGEGAAMVVLESRVSAGKGKGDITDIDRRCSRATDWRHAQNGASHRSRVGTRAGCKLRPSGSGSAIRFAGPADRGP